MKNKRIREALFETGIRQYELAALLGVSDMTLFRKLRFELPDEEQERIIKVINEEYTRRQTQ